MNYNEYRNAYRYASKFTKDYLDVVHDAYLYYKLSTTKELFDEPNSVVIQQVRRQYNRTIGTNKHRWQWRGERNSVKHYSLSEDVSREMIEGVFGIHTGDLVSTIHVEYEIERLNKKLTEKQQYILGLAYQGYNGSDIAELEGVNRSSVNKSLRLIRNKANYVI